MCETRFDLKCNVMKNVFILGMSNSNCCAGRKINFINKKFQWAADDKIFNIIICFKHFFPVILDLIKSNNTYLVAIWKLTFHYANLKTSLRATKDKQWGRMRPAGRQFDMPGLYVWDLIRANCIKSG